MPTLTLTIDEDLLARAERLAVARNMTVPEMVERLLRVAAQPPVRVEDLPPATRHAYGTLPPMTDDEVERAIGEARMRKYGRT